MWKSDSWQPPRLRRYHINNIYEKLSTLESPDLTDTSSSRLQKDCGDIDTTDIRYKTYLSYLFEEMPYVKQPGNLLGTDEMWPF